MDCEQHLEQEFLQTTTMFYQLLLGNYYVCPNDNNFVQIRFVDEATATVAYCDDNMQVLVKPRYGWKVGVFKVNSVEEIEELVRNKND